MSHDVCPERWNGISMIRRLPMAWFILSLGAMPAVLLQGCNSDESVCRPEVPAGRIEGVVQCGGLAFAAEVRAARIRDATYLEAVFSADADDTGRYSLDLPEGSYTLRLVMGGSEQIRYSYATSGLIVGQGAPDTLAIEPGGSPLIIDFALGGLSVDVGLSPALNGEIGEVRLHPRTIGSLAHWRTYVDRAGARIDDGRLSVNIPGIFPDEYRVEIILGYRGYACLGWQYHEGEHVWYPGVLSPDDSPWIPIAADSLVSLSMDLPVETARIEGWITGAWLELGYPPSPELALIGPDGETLVGSRLVNRDGSFGVDVHLPGPVRLRVTQGGVEQWIGGGRFEDATAFQLESGRTVSGVELVQCGLLCRFEVPDLPPERVVVRLFDPVDLSLVATFAQDSGHGHVVGIPNLRPGDYLIEFSPREPGEAAWLPQWYDRAAGPEGARTITLAAPGEVGLLRVILEREGALPGAR